MNLLGAIVLFCAILLSPYKSHANDEFILPDVIFYEIMWMGSSVSSADEWIVLKNISDDVIDITGWKITGFGKNHDKVIALSGVIGKNGYFLLSNNTEKAKYSAGESVLNIKPDQYDTGMDIYNTVLGLKLFDKKSREIDSTDGGTEAPFAGINGKDGNPKVAMARKMNPVGAGFARESWQDSDGLIHGDIDHLDFGVKDVANPQNSNKPIITSELTESMSTELSIPFVIDLTVENGNGQLSSQVNNDPSTKKVIAEGNNKISINCPKIGQQEISIRVTDETGLYYEIKGELFCYQFADLVINEIYPAPQKGEEEWVEIFNPTDNEINLEKWRLVDESGTDFTFTSSHVISPKGYLKVVPEGVSLNNTGDTIELFSPADELVSSTQWGKAKKGTSWAKFDNNYKWTLSPTPSAINILTEEQGNEEDEDSDEDESVTTGSEDELSGGGESEGDYAITTKKTSGGDKLLALALNTEQLPKITISQNFSENSSLPSPLPQENSIVVGVTVGSIGVLALAKIVLSMISLWL